MFLTINHHPDIKNEEKAEQTFNNITLHGGNLKDNFITRISKNGQYITGTNYTRIQQRINSKLLLNDDSIVDVSHFSIENNTLYGYGYTCKQLIQDLIPGKSLLNHIKAIEPGIYSIKFEVEQIRKLLVEISLPNNTTYVIQMPNWVDKDI